jgi:hypothetical protein
MGLDDLVQVIAYTHLESQIFKDTSNPFLYNVNQMMRKQLHMNNLMIGTQSKFNQLQFENAYHLPISIPEKKLLDRHDKPREGVLFVGRWEEGKNPELYLDLIEQTKLPARVMTNSTGAKKFEDRLKKLGVDYKIKSSIVGDEKVDFITSCRLAFNPSTVESYGIAFYEQLVQLPTFALDDVRWIKNFNGYHFNLTNKKKMAVDVIQAYERYQDAETYYAEGNLARAIAHENDIFHRWMDCFRDFSPKQSKSNTAKICNENTVKYRDYIENLGRNLICIDDIRSVLSNKNKFRVIYTDDDTYLTKDPSFVPADESSKKDFFTFTL